MKQNHYALACDERGTTRWPSPTNTWSVGGLIFEQSECKNLVLIWNNIKAELCGKENVELKWSHFFPGFHQERIDNPLIETDPMIWRKLAIWALKELFEKTNALPLSTYVRKNESSDSVFRITQDNRKILDISVIWVGVLGQFALFLKDTNSTGEIWFDNLGSTKEQSEKQEEWIRLREGDWPVNPENQLLLKAISREFTFLDSKSEPIIQVADFISGVTWAASEGDEIFLLRTLEKYMRKGKRKYRLLRLE